jgi:hypothetical protein
MASRSSIFPLPGLSWAAFPRVLLALGFLGACQGESTEVNGLASIAVSPQFATVRAGGTQQFSAVAKDENEDPLDGVTFTWKSSNSGVATVDASGLAMGVGEGLAEIRASAGGIRASGQLSVSDGPLLFSDGFETGNGSHTDNG